MGFRKFNLEAFRPQYHNHLGRPDFVWYRYKHNNRKPVHTLSETILVVPLKHNISAAALRSKPIGVLASVGSTIPYNVREKPQRILYRNYSGLLWRSE